MSNMNDIERRLGSHTLVPEEEYVTIKKEDLNDARWEIIELRKETGHKQAVIDRLMWEFCPDEMTEEQIEKWASRQVPVSVEIAEALNAALEESSEMIDPGFWVDDD